MECWEKTEEFDRFYKTVQAAHLILLNSKYAEPTNQLDTVEVKNEPITMDDSFSEANLTATISNCDYDFSEQEDRLHHYEHNGGKFDTRFDFSNCE